MSRLDEIYDAKFYQENLDNREAYDRLGDAIHAVIPTGPVFDVGSGAGLVLARLHQLGHRVRGVEGSRHGIAATPLEVRSRITHGDVTDLPTYFAETAICVEVAEHLPSSAADALVSAVASVADSAIVWSAVTGARLYRLGALSASAFQHPLAFSPDSRFLITAVGDGSNDLRLWNSETGTSRIPFALLYSMYASMF